MLIHTDYDTVGLKGMRRQNQQAAAAVRPAGRHAGRWPSAPCRSPAPCPAREEDPELAAYNARLAQLAEKGPKTWRNRDEVVVRRAQ